MIMSLDPWVRFNSVVTSWTGSVCAGASELVSVSVFVCAVCPADLSAAFTT